MIRLRPFEPRTPGTVRPTACCMSHRAAFSLVEVVIAIGVVATAVTAVVALLAALSRHASGADQSLAATRLADSVTEALLELAAADGLQSLAMRVPAMTSDPESALLFLSDRSGLELRPATEGGTGADEGFFLVCVRRFGDGPLRLQPDACSAAFNVVVMWPYLVSSAEGAPRRCPPADRERIEFNVAVRSPL